MAASASCASPGRFVWVEELKMPAVGAVDEYVIGVGDVISVSVYEQDALSAKLKVRADGRISLPFVGEVAVRGKHPSALARELEGLFKQYINAPRVTVNVDDFEPVSVTLTGEVAKPGVYTFPRSPGLLQALANAGNFTEDADRTAIFVLRRFPEAQRIRFRYESLVHNERRAVSFALQSDDVVVVE